MIGNILKLKVSCLAAFLFSNAALAESVPSAPTKKPDEIFKYRNTVLDQDFSMTENTFIKATNATLIYLSDTKDGISIQGIYGYHVFSQRMCWDIVGEAIQQPYTPGLAKKDFNKIIGHCYLEKGGERYLVSKVIVTRHRAEGGKRVFRSKMEFLPE